MYMYQWLCFVFSCCVTYLGAMKGKFVCKDGYPVSTFILEDHIVSAALNQSLVCCIHGNLRIQDMTPDLVRGFFSLFFYCSKFH